MGWSSSLEKAEGKTLNHRSDSTFRFLHLGKTMKLSSGAAAAALAGLDGSGRSPSSNIIVQGKKEIKYKLTSWLAAVPWHKMTQPLEQAGCCVL